MLGLLLLAAAALRAPDEFPPLGPAEEGEPGRAWGAFAVAGSVWLELASGDVRVSGSSADEVSLRDDLGMTGLAFPVPVRLVYKQEKTIYELGLWCLEHSGSARAKGNFTFDGVAVVAGEKIRSDLSVGFYKLAYRKVVWDSQRFRFLVDAGLDFLDVEVALRAPAGNGKLDELIPVVNVGLEMEARVAPEIYVALRTTGLSWSDLLGFQGDLFSIQGKYRHLEAGVLWRTSLRTYVGVAYRFLQVGFSSSEKDAAADMRFQGLAFTARYWW